MADEAVQVRDQLVIAHLSPSARLFGVAFSCNNGKQTVLNRLLLAAKDINNKEFRSRGVQCSQVAIVLPNLRVFDDVSPSRFPCQ